MAIEYGNIKTLNDIKTDMIYILIFLNLIIASSQHITHDLGTRTIAIQIKYFYCLLFIISRVTSVKCIVYKFTALYLVYIFGANEA